MQCENYLLSMLEPNTNTAANTSALEIRVLPICWEFIIFITLTKTIMINANRISISPPLTIVSNSDTKIIHNFQPITKLQMQYFWQKNILNENTRCIHIHPLQGIRQILFIMT